MPPSAASRQRFQAMTVYLDTNCVIYFVEQDPVWLPKIVTQLSRFRAAKDELAIGDLTRAECLVGPFKRGDAKVEGSYRTFFSDPDIKMLPITAAICERSARIRARYSFKLPDALHLATAAENGCGLFLTADTKLAGYRRFPSRC